MLDRELLRTVSRIELSTRSVMDTLMAGAYHSSFKGNGMEFSEVREYVQGDDVRTIDWNVTARTGHPHVKKFVEERELTLMLVVDASPSSHFGTRKSFKSEAMATAAALLAFAAIRNNDKVGLLMFTDTPELFIPPAKGRRHVLRLIREMLFFKAKGVRTRLDTALDHLGHLLNRRAVVVVLSDFLDTGFEKSLKMLRTRHDVLALSVADPRELELPDAGFVELEDPESGECVLVDTGDASFRAAFAREAARSQKLLDENFRRMSVDHVRMVVRDTPRDTVTPLLDYFHRRARHAHR